MEITGHEISMLWSNDIALPPIFVGANAVTPKNRYRKMLPKRSLALTLPLSLAPSLALSLAPIVNNDRLR